MPAPVPRPLIVPRPDLRLICTDEGAGPTVVLLHAGGERRGVWSPVAHELAAAGFRSVAVDQRGHGETGGHGDRLSEYVDDACALLQYLGTPSVLVGCSLGGLVSLLACQRAAPPDRVAAVILVDVVPEPPAEPARAYLKTIESPRRPWNWTLVEDILASRPLLLSAAVELTVPMALIRGEHGSVSEADCRALQSGVPSLAVRTVAGAGHLVARDQPNQLAAVLLELFGSLPLSHWRAP